MSKKLIITNILSITLAVAGTLFAVGCSDNGAGDPDAPARSLEDAPFDRVKVYIPKTDEDQKRLHEHKEVNGLNLSLFSKEELTMEYTEFSHSYQLVADQNGEPQLQEVQASPEEIMEVEQKQTLTFQTTEAGRVKLESQREGIGGHAACYLDEADATDNTLATRYLLCQGNLLVIEKDVDQEEDADTEDDADAEGDADAEDDA